MNTKATKKQNIKIQIGIEYMVQAMQLEGFGHEEIMSMREAMETNDFSKIEFVSKDNQ